MDISLDRVDVPSFTIPQHEGYLGKSPGCYRRKTSFKSSARLKICYLHPQAGATEYDTPGACTSTPSMREHCLEGLSTAERHKVRRYTHLERSWSVSALGIDIRTACQRPHYLDEDKDSPCHPVFSLKACEYIPGA